MAGRAQRMAQRRVRGPMVPSRLPRRRPQPLVVDGSALVPGDPGQWILVHGPVPVPGVPRAWGVGHLRRNDLTGRVEYLGPADAAPLTPVGGPSRGRRRFDGSSDSEEPGPVLPMTPAERADLYRQRWQRAAERIYVREAERGRPWRMES